MRVGLLLCAALLLGACQDHEPSPEPSADPATSTASASVSPAELGFDERALNRLAAAAEQDRSTCFLVARHGTVVFEKYWYGGGVDVDQEVFSVTKSVTSTLVGLAQADGDLSVDDAAADHIKAWRGTPSASVTVRDLLANDSGRFWSPDSDYSSLVQAEDRTAYAVGLAQQVKPGTVWAYNNSAIQTLDAVLRSATGTDPASFAADRLFGPLGMTHTGMTADSSGHSTNVFFGMHSTCRDLARFGTLFAQQGEWDGEQLVPSEWVEAATGAPSQELNAAYGLLWWLNRKGAIRLPIDADNPGLPPGVDGAGQLAPGAPEHLFAALGFGGQVVLVDPSSDTVVVRLGGPGDAASRDYSFRDATRVITQALTDSP